MKSKTSVIIGCKRHIGTNLKSWYFTLQLLHVAEISQNINIFTLESSKSPRFSLSIKNQVFQSFSPSSAQCIIPAENIIPVPTFFFNYHWIFDISMYHYSTHKTSCNMQLSKYMLVYLISVMSNMTVWQNFCDIAITGKKSNFVFKRYARRCI